PSVEQLSQLFLETACSAGERQSGQLFYASTLDLDPNMVDSYLAAAIEEARKGLSEGGIPIGSVLVLDANIIGRGHNRRVQQGSPILHAEMDCFENAGRLSATEYLRCTLYSTVSACDMCSGAAL
ncbi:MAG: nucleoside deaminase, partial [Rubripirellula sp.]